MGKKKKSEDIEGEYAKFLKLVRMMRASQKRCLEWKIRKLKEHAEQDEAGGCVTMEGLVDDWLAKR